MSITLHSASILTERQQADVDVALLSLLMKKSVTEEWFTAAD